MYASGRGEMSLFSGIKSDGPEVPETSKRFLEVFGLRCPILIALLSVPNKSAGS